MAMSKVSGNRFTGKRTPGSTMGNIGSKMLPPFSLDPNSRGTRLKRLSWMVFGKKK